MSEDVDKMFEQEVLGPLILSAANKIAATSKVTSDNVEKMCEVIFKQLGIHAQDLKDKIRNSLISTTRRILRQKRKIE